MNINDIIHGFKLIKKDRVKEAASDTFEVKLIITKGFYRYAIQIG